MAFILNSNFSGIVVENAYARIEDFNGSKNGMDIQLAYYASKQGCDAGESSFKRESFSFVPDVSDNSGNYHKQGYEHLKTLPEFTGSIDA